MLNRAGAYRRNRDYDAELRHWAPLVRKTALHLMARLPRSVQLDDLVQTGMIGLFEALQGFDPGRGIKFETYAQTRIRGAMIDDLRNVDWAPRSVHRNARLIEDTMADLAQELGRSPTAGEIAQRLRVSQDDYGKMLYETSVCTVVGMDDLGVPEDSLVGAGQNAGENQVFGQIASEEFRKSLAEAIEQLPKREGVILSLYYTEGLNLKEIGRIFDVSESRVSQILNQAVLRLRSRLRDWV